jgi:hypothetical protein
MKRRNRRLSLRANTRLPEKIMILIEALSKSINLIDLRGRPI